MIVLEVSWVTEARQLRLVPLPSSNCCCCHRPRLLTYELVTQSSVSSLAVEFCSHIESRHHIHLTVHLFKFTLIPARPFAHFFTSVVFVVVHIVPCYRTRSRNVNNAVAQIVKIPRLIFSGWEQCGRYLGTLLINDTTRFSRGVVRRNQRKATVGDDSVLGGVGSRAKSNKTYVRSKITRAGIRGF